MSARRLPQGGSSGERQPKSTVHNERKLTLTRTSPSLRFLTRDIPSGYLRQGTVLHDRTAQISGLEDVPASRFQLWKPGRPLALIATPVLQFAPDGMASHIEAARLTDTVGSGLAGFRKRNVTS